MTGPQIITQLRTMCLQAEERVADYARKKAADEALIVHYRAVIADVDGREKGSSGPTSMSVASLFQRGEVFARCVQALRDRGPELTTSELADHCLRSKDLDPTEAPLRRAMAQNLVEVLKLREAKGEIVTTGKRGVVRVWCLPSPQ